MQAYEVLKDHQSVLKISKKLCRKKIRPTVKDADEYLDAEEKRLRDQRYLNVLHDLTRLRDHYYSVYLEKLEKKVSDQRKAFAAREEKIQRKILRENKKKAELAHKFVQRLPRHDLKHNEDFLKRVPKSHFYHLTAVEELMKSRGVLKNRHDVDEFWEKAKSDRSFWTRPIPPSVSPDALTEHMLSRYSSQTNHSKREIFNTTSSKLPAGILKASHVEPEENGVRTADEETPLIFPEPPKFPKLHSFKLDLKSNFPSLPQSIDSEARTRVEENRHHRRQRIKQHMKHDAYNLAVVNTTMAGRLLAKHSLKSLDLHPLSEISEIWCSQSDSTSIAAADTKSASQKVKATHGTAQNKRSKRTRRNHDELQSIRETHGSETDASVLTPPTEKVRQPLTMGMMLTADNVTLKETKTKTAMWTNYTATK